RTVPRRARRGVGRRRPGRLRRRGVARGLARRGRGDAGGAVVTRIDFVTGAPEKYAHLVDRLAEVPVRLRHVVTGPSVTELRRDPGNGEWGPPRILAHMAVVAQHNGVFIYRMGTMTDPRRTPYDGDAEADRLQHQNPIALVETIEDEIGKTLAFLSRTPDAS